MMQAFTTDCNNLANKGGYKLTQLSSFSERMGFTSPRSVIQIDGIDDKLRITLWNCFYEVYLSNFCDRQYLNEQYEFGSTFKRLWMFFYINPITDMPTNTFIAEKFLNEYFFSCPWYRVYDFLEFIVKNHSDEHKNEKFCEYINFILELNLSGYRLVSKVFTQITSESEIESIENALNVTGLISPINTHLTASLQKLSDRENPDPRNSIKESISAVECIIRMITKNPNATLGEGLNFIEKKKTIKMHGALKNGFSSLYGWTNDAEGIRHSLMDDPTLNFDDAKFMLVSCSAFINFLISKANSAGIDLNS